MFLQITALTETPEEALKLRQIVQGLIALVQMQMAAQENLPVLGETVQVAGAENVVQLTAEIATDSLIEMIKFLQERKKQEAAHSALLKAKQARARALKAAEQPGG